MTFVVKHSGCDGSHRGLADWYDDLERGIVLALAQGPKFQWTTGWYSSKHEIACAKISGSGSGMLCVEASVSDDFDTEGCGQTFIPHTQDLDEIRQAIYKAWDEACENKRDNEMFAGYSVIGKSENMNWNGWIETYLKPQGDGWYLDEPPGDNYFEWGWQNEAVDIPDDVREALRKWADENDEGEFEYKGYTIKPWSDD